MTAAIDRRALADLHEATYRWSLFCCRFDDDAAREVLQTVYLEVLAGRARFRGEAALQTWLFAVVKRTAARHAGRQRRQVRLAERLAHAGEAAAAAVDGGERAVAGAESRRLVDAGLERLPARQRAVIELIYYHDMTIAECARVMGIHPGTASRHLYRAKRALGRDLAAVKGELTYG